MLSVVWLLAQFVGLFLSGFLACIPPDGVCLTLLCQDCPKMGDSMSCHNFAHRIAQKWVILWSLLETF
jgi:hypothetical protein